MTQEIRIEPAGEEHVVAIQTLAGLIWRACYPGIISREQIDYMLGRMYSPETLHDEMRSQGICYERLLAGDELIGFAAYGPAEQPGAFKLHKLYLHPAWQGRGLGSQLLRHCEDAVGIRDARRLLLNVNKRNARAIAVYRWNGFEIIEPVVVDIGSGFAMDDYIMTKELNPER